MQRLMEAIENCIDPDTAARLSSELEAAEAAVERRLQSNRYTDFVRVLRCAVGG